MNNEIYIEHGYESRRHYLECMADDWGIPLDTVMALANLLGPEEDFDGLVNALDDAAFESGNIG